MKWFIAVAVVGIAFSAGQAFADNFRCPNGNIVSTGYTRPPVQLRPNIPAGLTKTKFVSLRLELEHTRCSPTC